MSSDEEEAIGSDMRINSDVHTLSRSRHRNQTYEEDAATFPRHQRSKFLSPSKQGERRHLHQKLDQDVVGSAAKTQQPSIRLAVPFAFGTIDAGDSGDTQDRRSTGITETGFHRGHDHVAQFA